MMIGQPSETQDKFLKEQHRYVAFGGARGGGKSWAVRSKAILLAANYPGITQTIVRRTYPELDANHIKPIKAMLPSDYYKYNDSKKELKFKNGSEILFRYCANDGDLDRFQGTETDILYIDEATQLTEYQFSVLNATVRGVNGFPKRTYLTCNPGGVGHQWVKRLFIDRQYQGSEIASNYVFIPSRVTDNKALMESDSEYVQRLMELPDRLRKAWLEGSWEIVDGLYFDEYDYAVHTIDSIDTSGEGWNYYCSLDYGLDMLAAYVYACDSNRQVYVIRECYKSGLVVKDAAEAVRQLISGLNIKTIYAPPDLWNTSSQTGRSIADGFAASGISLVKTSNNVQTGSLYVKELLQVRLAEDGNKKPRLQIVRSACPNLIRCMSQILVDDKDPTIYAKEPHELTHSIDALRYFAIQWWMPGRAPIPEDAQKNRWTKSMWEDYQRATAQEKIYLRQKWGKPN